MKKFLRHFTIVFFLLIFFPLHSVQSETLEKVMIVLDASGSMWGQIDQEPKINIARRVIQNLLENWDNKIALGLCVYGHRQKSDCNDIEILVPVAKENKEKILTAIKEINPKGKTPLSDASR